ncbi:molecular chaperone [Pantoea sp. 1.19]|uniref:fimbrial biogenesis chaperone n=1 Tax=Pantoea sp. 1.19 TaxID=1925589 RepID=UPI000AD2A417
MNLLATLLLCGSLFFSALATAANALLIWPVDPTLNEGQRATELWLENRGAETTLMQVRIFGWQQRDGREQFSTQQNVVASPPQVRIEPGKRQLVRLIAQQPAPAGQEAAFRVVLDEIPTPPAPGSSPGGLNLQMRYSLPLFQYGSGLDKASATPVLQWRVIQQAGKPQLHIVNRGRGHARLSRVSLAGRPINDGLLGYVLAASTQRFPLPFAAGNSGELRAELGGQRTPWRSHSAQP